MTTIKITRNKAENAPVIRRLHMRGYDLEFPPDQDVFEVPAQISQFLLGFTLEGVHVFHPYMKDQVKTTKTIENEKTKEEGV